MRWPPSSAARRGWLWPLRKEEAGLRRGGQDNDLSRSGWGIPCLPLSLPPSLPFSLCLPPSLSPSLSPPSIPPSSLPSLPSLPPPLLLPYFSFPPSGCVRPRHRRMRSHRHKGATLDPGLLGLQSWDQEDTAWISKRSHARTYGPGRSKGSRAKHVVGSGLLRPSGLRAGIRRTLRFCGRRA